GAKRRDVVAGLAYSIADNYISRIVGTRRVGDKVLFQGGVALNRAVALALALVAHLWPEGSTEVPGGLSGLGSDQEITEEAGAEEEEEEALEEDEEDPREIAQASSCMTTKDCDQGQTCIDGTCEQWVSRDRGLWDAETGRGYHALKGHGARINAITYAPSGEQIATASEDGTARLWDTATGRETHLLDGHRGPVLALGYAPDGAQVATAGQDGTTRLWDTETGRELYVLRGHQGPVRHVTYTPDGTQLATGSDDTNLIVWDMNRDKLEARSRHDSVTWTEHEAAITALRFSSQGKRLATGGLDREVVNWNVVAGGAGQFRSHFAHSDAITAVDYSPDEALLATGSRDTTARIWHIDKTNAKQDILRGHRAPITAVAFAPNGHQVATASADTTARIWELTPQEVAARSKRGPEGEALSEAGTPVAGTETEAGGDDQAPFPWARFGYLLLGLAALLELSRFVWWRRTRTWGQGLSEGPWHDPMEPEAMAVPAFSPSQVEEAAVSLTHPASRDTSDHLDVHRTVLATVRAGMFPQPVYQPAPPTPDIAVLLDSAPTDAPWHRLAEELFETLERMGVGLVRFRFTGDPTWLDPVDEADPPRRLQTLAHDDFDALVLVGEATQGLDPLTGEPAPWLRDLAAFKHAVWLHPLPTSRWSAGALETGRHVPMTRLVTEEIGTLWFGAGKAPDRPYPRILERAPASPEGLAALQDYLGPAGFHWLCAAATAPVPSSHIAAWIGRTFACNWTESDRLALFSLPYWAEEAWPEGLRSALLDQLRAEDPALEARIRGHMQDILTEDALPPDSLAHQRRALVTAQLGWEGGDQEALDQMGALRRALGDEAVLEAVGASVIPFGEDTERARERLTRVQRRGFGDRRLARAAMVMSTALIVAGAAALGTGGEVEAPESPIAESEPTPGSVAEDAEASAVALTEAVVLRGHT
ncbi:MAG: hypothetical protein QF464_07050, partial [Myxococcota bacterium]|nr:hypothetical protein [Myxococcota bacterium]